MEKEDLFVNYADLLKNEYKEMFERIDIYIASHGLVVDDTSEMMEDVIDLLLTAQENQTPIEKIIGTDFEKFCNQLIESHKNSIIDNFLSYFQWFRYIALVSGILELFNVILDYQDNVMNPWSVPVSIGEFCIGIAFPFFIVFIFNIIRKKLILKQWYTHKIDTALITLLMLISVVSCFVISNYISSIISIPRFIFIPFTIIFFILMTIRKRKQKKEKKHISFDIMAYNEMIKIYREEYQKYVKTCQKKNKECADVKQWYEKKYKNELLGQRITDMILIFIILGFIVFVAKDSEIFDTIIFTTLITCIEIPIFYFFHKGNRMRKIIYKEIKYGNIDIYSDELLKEE